MGEDADKHALSSFFFLINSFQFVLCLWLFFRVHKELLWIPCQHFLCFYWEWIH